MEEGRCRNGNGRRPRVYENDGNVGAKEKIWTNLL
jgi:hypothetical protein